MRLLLGAILLIAPLSLAGVAPAHASDISERQVATAFSVMMNRAEARQLGADSRVRSDFGVAHVQEGTPDAPCLCTITDGVTVNGDGAKSLASMAYLSDKGTAVEGVSQEVHIFATRAQARRAYAVIREQSRKCSGEHLEATVSTDESAKNMTVQLSNGTKIAKGGSDFIWVRAVTTNPGEGGFASHEYLTIRQFGRFVQIIELENEGVGAQALAPKEIARADQLATALGDKWQAAFK